MTASAFWQVPIIYSEPRIKISDQDSWLFTFYNSKRHAINGRKQIEETDCGW